MRKSDLGNTLCAAHFLAFFNNHPNGTIQDWYKEATRINLNYRRFIGSEVFKEALLSALQYDCCVEDSKCNSSLVEVFNDAAKRTLLPVVVSNYPIRIY